MRLTASPDPVATVKLPLVSVVITNKNYERYVGAAIQSAHSQTYQNLECIVVDDHSNDDSFSAIMDTLARLDDPRFRCIRLGRSLGQMAAFKAGLENSNGQFIASLDADDFWLSSFVEAHLMAHLNTTHSAGLTSSDTMQIDQDGCLLEATFHMHGKIRSQLAVGKHNAVPEETVPGMLAGQAVFPSRKDEFALLYVDRGFQGWPFVAMSSFMFRRALIEMIIPDDTEATRICADYYLARFCHNLSGSLLIAQAHSVFRIHQKNQFSKNGVLGGPHRPGYFAPELARALERSMANHIIAYIDRFEAALGIEYCMKLISQAYTADELVEAVKDAPKLRNEYGRGKQPSTPKGTGFFRRIAKMPGFLR